MWPYIHSMASSSVMAESLWRKLLGLPWVTLKSSRQAKLLPKCYSPHGAQALGSDTALWMEHGGWGPGPLRGTWRLGARPMGGPVGERPQSGAQSLSGFRSESRSRLARWATLATLPNEISHQPAGTNEQLALLCWDSAPRTMG